MHSQAPRNALVRQRLRPVVPANFFDKRYEAERAFVLQHHVTSTQRHAMHRNASDLSSKHRFRFGERLNLHREFNFKQKSGFIFTRDVCTVAQSKTLAL